METARILIDHPALAALAFLGAINLLALGQFWFDKQSALHGGWRISEAALIATAFLGGYPGAKLGQRLFRHKTRKQPFGRDLDRAGMIGVLLIACLAVPTSREMLLGGLVQGISAVQAFGGAETPEPPRPRVLRF